MFCHLDPSVADACLGVSDLVGVRRQVASTSTNSFIWSPDGPSPTEVTCARCPGQGEQLSQRSRLATGLPWEFFHCDEPPEVPRSLKHFTT